jgi:hypothetical protein
MKLMTVFDAPRVEIIKREFERRDNKVDQADFITIMLKHLPSHLYSNHDNSADELLELFKEVDVNGDGSMDWEELTRFMVSKAALLKENTMSDSMLPYHHNKQLEDSLGVPITHHRHRDSIDGMCLLPRNKQFACIENHSPVITLYNARNSSLVSTMHCKAVPLSICYVEPHQSLIACCSDSTMVRFDVGDSHKVSPPSNFHHCMLLMFELTFFSHFSGLPSTEKLLANTRRPNGHVLATNTQPLVFWFSWRQSVCLGH